MDETLNAFIVVLKEVRLHFGLISLMPFCLLYARLFNLPKTCDSLFVDERIIHDKIIIIKVVSEAGLPFTSVLSLWA